GTAGHPEEQSVLHEHGGNCGVLWTSAQRRTGSHDDHVVLLCVLLRYDAIGRGVWRDCINRVRGACVEVPADVGWDEEITEAFLLLRSLYTGVGDLVRRIFRKYRGYCIREVLRDSGECPGALVHPAQ